MKPITFILLLSALWGCGKQDIPPFISTKGSDECPFGDVYAIKLGVYILDPATEAVCRDSLKFIRTTEYTEEGLAAGFSELYPRNAAPLHTEFRYLRNYILAVSEDDGMNHKRYIPDVKRNRVKVAVLDPDGSGFTDTDRFRAGRRGRKTRETGGGRFGWDYRYDGAHISEIASFGMDENHIVRYQYLAFDTLSNWLSRIRYVYPSGGTEVIEKLLEQREIVYR